MLKNPEKQQLSCAFRPGRNAILSDEPLRERSATLGETPSLMINILFFKVLITTIAPIILFGAISNTKATFT